jgi:hypothetical protein
MYKLSTIIKSETPIIAYRLWHSWGGCRLESLSAGYPMPRTGPWKFFCCREYFSGPAGPAWSETAEWKPYEHSVPNENCVCGFWGVKKDSLRTNLPFMCEGCLIGKVAMWGTVIEHEHGYRAEFSYPQVLFEPRDIKQKISGYSYKLHALANEMGLEILPMGDELEELYPYLRDSFHKNPGGHFHND